MYYKDQKNTYTIEEQARIIDFITQMLCERIN